MFVSASTKSSVGTLGGLGEVMYEVGYVCV